MPILPDQSKLPPDSSWELVFSRQGRDVGCGISLWLFLWFLTVIVLASEWISSFPILFFVHQLLFSLTFPTRFSIEFFAFCILLITTIGSVRFLQDLIHPQLVMRQGKVDELTILPIMQRWSPSKYAALIKVEGIKLIYQYPVLRDESEAKIFYDRTRAGIEVIVVYTAHAHQVLNIYVKK